MTLSAAAHGRVGQDYVASSGTLTLAAGETARSIAVTVLDDTHDEGEETFTLHLSNAAGAELADAEATGTIVNSDPMPRAWLGRFGRTAGEHTLDAVEQRLRTAGTPATGAAVGVGKSPPRKRTRLSAGRRSRRWRPGSTHGNGDLRIEAVSGRELLAGSEFQVATPASDGRVLTVWGRARTGALPARKTSSH